MLSFPKMKTKPYSLHSISYSAYRDYKKCPRLFYYRRILKLKMPNQPLPLVFGKSLHLALELFVKEKKDPVEVFKKDFTYDKLDYMKREKFAEELAAGIHLLTFWKKNHKQLLAESGISINHTEMPFELQVDHDPVSKKKLDLPPIKGVIDFDINEFPALGDYKTSTKAYTQEMVEESDQPTFYNLWHLLVKGNVSDAFYYIVFRKKIKKAPVAILKTERTEQQISDLLLDLNDVYRKICEGKFDGRHKQGEFCDCEVYEKMLSTRYVNKKDRETSRRVFPRKMVHNHSSRRSR